MKAKMSKANDDFISLISAGDLVSTNTGRKMVVRKIRFNSAGEELCQASWHEHGLPCEGWFFATHLTVFKGDPDSFWLEQTTLGY